MIVGDRVRRVPTGEEGVVLKEEGLLVQVALASGTVWIHPDELEALPDGPDERLAAGELGQAEPYGLRLQSLYLKHAYRYDQLTGLSSARIEPQLHQVFVAHRVTQKLQPRMILADEVGLGKTVEAGLIIKELRARELISRVLIVVPASLQFQWQSELRSKFNEDFEIFDSAALKFLGRGGVNPWMASPNVICSLPFASNAKRAEQIIEAGWDLVVFDEAHRVRRSRQSARKTQSTQAYRLADELKEMVNGLLLLTATPMQLHPFELYSLIELVEPGLFPAFTAYDSRRGFLPELNALMKTLKGWKALGEDEQATAAQVHHRLLDGLGVGQQEALAVLAQDAERERLMDVLTAKHPLAGTLTRNRKAEIGGFTARDAVTVPVKLEPEELHLYEGVTEYLREGYNRARADKNNTLGFVMVTYQKMLASSSYAVRQSLRRRIVKLRGQLAAKRSVKAVSEDRLEELRDAEEATAALEELEGTAAEAGLRFEIDQLAALVDRLGKVRDSKAATLLATLGPIFEERPEEKAVIFTQFIETQEFLAAVLRQNGYAVSVFNGRMSLDEKEEAVRRFRDSNQLLVSTEAGGEGRNFQFCHLMVNYDLPWNPMKVEQRIGRLDRIGQKRPVLIYNLYCEDTVEERVLEVLHNRIGLFEESVGSLDPILGQVERDIERLVLAQLSTFDEEFMGFEADLERRVREAREKERTLADFVLDRASLRRDQALALLAQSPLARWSDLERFATDCLPYFGGLISDHAEGGKVVSLSPRLMTRLQQRQKTIRGTFDPEFAREHEDLPFFTFGHLLVNQLTELPVTVEPATTAIRHARDIPAGEWVEVYYEIRGEGVKPTGQFIRHLIGGDLQVRSQRLPGMPDRGGPENASQPPAWVRDALAASRQHFEAEYAAARGEIQADHDAAKDEAIARAERIFAYRRVRLSAQIEEQESWIRDKEISGSGRDRRVLPARRGQLAKNRERLATLELGHQQELEAIKNRQPGASATLLAAGVVTGS